MLYRLVHFLANIVLEVAFFLRIRGAENYKQIRGGFIVICNHTSNWDPIILGYSVKTKPVRYLAKEELFHNKFAAFMLKHLYAVPIARGTGDVGAIKAALQILADNDILGIFPEGTRSKTGELGGFEPGAALLALRAKVPVVPAYICGGYKLFHRVTIRFGKPVALSEMFPGKAKGATIREATEVLRKSMQELEAQADAPAKR